MTSLCCSSQKNGSPERCSKRLANLGLDPFCLELHSNKTNKTTVLAELDKALEVGKIKSPRSIQPKPQGSKLRKPSSTIP